MIKASIRYLFPTYNLATEVPRVEGRLLHLSGLRGSPLRGVAAEVTADEQSGEIRVTAMVDAASTAAADRVLADLVNQARHGDWTRADDELLAEAMQRAHDDGRRPRRGGRAAVGADRTVPKPAPVVESEPLREAPTPVGQVRRNQARWPAPARKKLPPPAPERAPGPPARRGQTAAGVLPESLLGRPARRTGA